MAEKSKGQGNQDQGTKGGQGRGNSSSKESGRSQGGSSRGNASMDEENRTLGPQLGKLITDSATGFAVPLRVRVAGSNG